MSIWGIRLNPWSNKYSTLENEQMRFLHKIYCETMEINENELPYQLKMNDKYNKPLYQPSSNDFDEHTFMRKMQNIVGLLRYPAESIILTICAYQKMRYERLDMKGYINDPRTLLLEEFKDWAMKKLAPSVATSEDILLDVKRRHSYILRIQHGQQNLFSSSNNERSLLSTLKDIRKIIEFRILPTIEAERAHSSARDQLHTLEARGTDGLIHGIQYLFYILRNNTNVPPDCSISNLQSQEKNGMKEIMQSTSGKLLQSLLNTKSFQILFPETNSNGNINSTKTLNNIDDTIIEKKNKSIDFIEVDTNDKNINDTCMFIDTNGNCMIPCNVLKSDKEKKMNIMQYLSDVPNSGLIHLKNCDDKLKKKAYDNFIRLHGMLKLLADLLVSCRKARQLAGPGGDLLVYGPGGEELRRLMQSFEIVQHEIIRLVNSLTHFGVKHLDTLKSKQEKAWRNCFSKVLPLENYIARDFEACMEPIQKLYANTDPIMVQKMFRQFRQSTGLWVKQNFYVCKEVSLILGLPFLDKNKETTISVDSAVHSIKNEINNDIQKDKILLLEDSTEIKDNQITESKLQMNEKASIRPEIDETKNINNKYMITTNGIENESFASITTKKLQDAANLVYRAVGLNTSPLKIDKKSNNYTEMNNNNNTNDDKISLTVDVENLTGSDIDSNEQQQIGMMDLLLLMRQTIQRLCQLSWGVKNSIHTSLYNENEEDLYFILCAVYESVNIHTTKNLFCYLRSHRESLIHLLQVYIPVIISNLSILRRRIKSKENCIQGMYNSINNISKVLMNFEKEIHYLVNDQIKIRKNCILMLEGILKMPNLVPKGEGAGRFALDSFLAIGDLVHLSGKGSSNALSYSAVLSHETYMHQMISQLDLHYNSLNHLELGAHGAVYISQQTCKRLKEFSESPRYSKISFVPEQQIEYIFEFNYDGFFSKSLNELNNLVSLL